MPNIIDSIQISSSTFDVRDKSATTVVNLTQDEYDNLPSSAKTANVLYNITDASPIDISQYWTSAQTQSAITEATSGKADTSYVDQSVSGKVDASTFEAYSGNVETALSGKQDALIAGENITISGNVISAEGGSITIDPSLDSGSTNPVANSAITTALNDTVKLSNLSTNYINGFTNYVNRTIPIFHRFNINNQSNGNAWWFGKINNKYVITTGQTSVTPSDLMNLQVIETSAITTSVTSSSTDAQVPSAKAVYDAIQEGGGIDSGTVQTMIDESITGKTNQSDFVSHSGNTTMHVTASEKSTWNNKSDFSGNYNDLSNKPTIPSKTSDLTNDSDFATTGDVQTATADMATKTWVGQQGYLTQHQSLSNYYTKSETSGATEISTALASKADKSEIPSLDGYATETWVEGKGYLTEHQDISGKLDVSAFNTYSGSVNTQLNSKASESDLNALNGVVTAHTANTTIHVTTQDKTNWNNKSDFSGSYNDLTDKPTIPTVPTNVSDFTNDAGYITSNDITGKTNQSDFTAHTANTTVHVTSAEKTTWNAKSDFSGDYNDLTNKLSAGTNVSIVDNVISAEGGGKAVSGGTNISVTTGETADTINCTLPITATSNVFNTISVGQGSGGGSYNTLIGPNARCDNNNGHNVFLVAQHNGNSASGAYVNGTNNVIIGSIKDGYLSFNMPSFTTSNSVVIGGGGISTDKNNSVAIGYSANVSGTTKTNINNQLTIDTSNQVYIYNKDNTEMICLQDQLGGGGGITSGDVQSMIDESISGKTDESAFTAHTADTTIHVTSSDKTTWSGKQDALVSGTNIKTINNESILGSGNITIQGGGSSVVELTQAQYDALTTIDPDTIYVITDAAGGDLSNYYTKAQINAMIGDIESLLAAI